MKKTILPLMIMLATFAVVPGNSNEPIKASAEEATSDVTNKTKNVEKGYITNKLVNSDGVIDLTGDTLTTFNSSVFSDLTAKPISYDDGMFKTTFLKYTESGKTLNGPTIAGSLKKTQYTYTASDDDYNNTHWGLTSLVATRPYDSSKLIKECFFTTKYGLDYAFEDWDTSKEQPFELAIPINLNDIETGIKRCFPFTLSADIAPKVGTKIEQTFPIISINGYDYFTATFKYTRTVSGPKVSIKYNTNNARAYIAYDENDDYANYVFLEIPFTNYLQTISIATYVQTIDDLKTSVPTSPKTIKTLTGAVNKAFKAPIVITDLDFNKGTVTTLTSNSVYLDSNNNATINAVDTDYVRLDSLVIDDEYTLYAKQTGQHPIEREEIYELYTDEAFKNRFTYSSNNALANKLQNAEDVQINITKYNYSILTKTSEDDTEYATSTDFVNCGNYYGFKKINKDQIHTATFNAFAARNAFYSRLAFNVYDNQAEMHINKINALLFTYKFKGEDMSLCITGKELDDTVSGGESIPQWAIYINPVVKYIKYFQDKGNTFYTKDKYLTKFGLHGMKDTDYFCFMDDWDAIHEYKQSNMFLLYTKETDVVFDSLVSCVYVDKAGDLINCSTIFPNGVEAPTAIIDEDGKVTIKDVNGTTIPGSVDKDGFFVDDKGERWDYPDNVPEPTDKWQEILDAIKKIGAILGTAAIVGGVIWTISKVGPTLVMIFKKKE